LKLDALSVVYPDLHCVKLADRIDAVGDVAGRVMHVAKEFPVRIVFYSPALFAGGWLSVE